MKNKLIAKIKNNFKGFIVIFVISATLFLCNYVESKACPVIYDKPEYIEGDYEVLNYFLDSLGISLPENFPPELKEYVSEGVFNLNSVEKRVFKEKLRRDLADIPDKANKELYFLVFCEEMRNLWVHELKILSYDDKIVEWSEKQGLKNGWLYAVDVSYLVRSGYMNINEEYVKEWEHSKLKGNNNENDTLKPE
ncbi:MAG: hypothetical protein FWG85_02995 [Bacteroidetes bacterium]|nr:hypothetical protein [Bacteroidota bacterium]